MKLPTIRHRKDGYYEVDMGRDDTGKRKVLVRASIEAAMKLAGEETERRKRIGGMALKLSIAEAADSYTALTMLREAGQDVSLSRVVHEWLTVSEVTAAVVNTGDALDDYLADKRAAGLRQESIDSATARLTILDSLRDKALHTITDSILSAVLASHTEWAPATKRGRLTELHTFFKWAIARKYLKTNPTERMTWPVVDRAAPEILTVMQANQMMNVAEQFGDQHFIVRLALLLFAGLRPAEAARITRADINTQAVRVSGAISKVRQHSRFVDISENLQAWLAAYPAGDPSKCKGWSGRYAAMLKTVKGIPTRHADITRKSWCSYHCAMHGNPPLTAAQMGHTHGLQMMYQHYRVPVAKDDAVLYFGIVPTQISENCSSPAKN